MNYRKLRIAWSVAWGVACLLLIVLWVRSYWRVEAVILPAPKIVVGWVAGSLGFESSPSGPPAWTKFNLTVDEWLAAVDPQHSYSRVWGSFYVQSDFLLVPIWFLLGIAMSFAATPWLRQLPYQFSLRTLLIAMTLVAVGLGLAVYAAR